jgi:ATP-dependent Lon protease
MLQYKKEIQKQVFQYNFLKNFTTISKNINFKTNNDNSNNKMVPSIKKNITNFNKISNNLNLKNQNRFFSNARSKEENSVINIDKNDSKIKKSYKIIPIKIKEVLMPYGKTIKIQKNDEIVKLLNNFKNKPEDVYYCVFTEVKKNSIVFNIGVLCSNIYVASSGDEISLTSLDFDCRVHCDSQVVNSENFFLNNKSLNNNKNEKKNNSKNSEEETSENNIENNPENLTEEISLDIAVKDVIEFVDDELIKNEISDFENAKNLLSDVNKSIFSFYEVITKQQFGQGDLREVNTAIVYLQGILKQNMDFINSLSNLTLYSEEDEITLKNLRKNIFKKKFDNINSRQMKTQDLTEEMINDNLKSNFEEDFKDESDVITISDDNIVIDNEDIEAKNEKDLNEQSEQQQENLESDNLSLQENKNDKDGDENLLQENKKNREQKEEITKDVKNLSGEINNEITKISNLKDIISYKKSTEKSAEKTTVDKETAKNRYKVSKFNQINNNDFNNEAFFNEQQKINDNMTGNRNSNSRKRITKTKFQHDFNNLVFINIQEFVKIAKGFRKSLPLKESSEILNCRDPMQRIKLLSELINEIGDYLIKDLHMQDEYKKDLMQKQEKYFLRFVKKRLDKETSGENVEQYNTKLENMFKNGDISEPVKRSIQLEIDLAFNSAISNNESEIEDTKKFNILQDIFNFPWDKRQEIEFDVKYTSKVLNEELFGLNKVKDRIDEYIAKLKRKHGLNQLNSNTGKAKKSNGFVILITGPPGTGKTTIATLIGKALKRKTAIINLSGETDTINLKGSRRTYVDSQPSIFFKEMVKLGVKNPVIILDEIDKIANRGDKTSHSASSALLELLNPEENHNFIDQFLNIPLDFSETIFICTSNYNVNLLEPLLDRVEILEIDDYTFKEKIEITERYLIPKLLGEYGLKSNNISTSLNNTNNLSEETIQEVINKDDNSNNTENTENEELDENDEVNYDISDIDFIKKDSSGNSTTDKSDKSELEINQIEKSELEFENPRLNKDSETFVNKNIVTNNKVNKNINIIFPSEVIEEMIRDYTPATTGCRGIKRSIEKLVRKINIDLFIDPRLNNAKKFIVDMNIVNKYLGIHKTADENLLKLIKESKFGYLISDGYGNIGRITIKQRPIEMLESQKDKDKILKIFKNISSKDIYKNLETYCKLSKPVQESLDTATFLARKQILTLLGDNTPLDLENLIKAYSLYMTYPYQEKFGNTFGLVFYIYLVANIFEFDPIEENMLILGELNMKGHILKIVNLKYILSSCEYYGINRLMLPEGKFFLYS